MTTLSIDINGSTGLTWPLWKQLVNEIEPLGFHGLYVMDGLPHVLGEYADSLEPMVALTYLAEHTERVQSGPVVALIAARDPVLLARQIMAVDELSGGRMLLGLGAGGQSRMFGYALGDGPDRFARLEEGLEVITRLLRSTEPVSFAGNVYQLEEAQLLPRPQRPHGIPILVGGSGPKRTLPLVARYADIWNPQMLTPDTFRERAGQLDELLRAEGRPPSAVKRTVDVRVVCGRSSEELEQRVTPLRRRIPALASMPLDGVLEMMRTHLGVLVGPPDVLIAHMQALSAAGAEEIIIEWGTPDDLAGIRVIAEEVLPHVQA